MPYTSINILLYRCGGGKVAREPEGELGAEESGQDAAVAEEAGEQEAERQARRQYLAELKQELHGGGLLTAPEVAEILEVHPRTVTEYIRTGVLPAYQFGGAWKVSEATLRAFLRQQLPQHSSPQKAAKAPPAPALPWRRKPPANRCSFCGKAQEQVRRLVAGPNVYICDECVILCNEFMAEELAPPRADRDDAPAPPLHP